MAEATAFIKTRPYKPPQFSLNLHVNRPSFFSAPRQVAGKLDDIYKTGKLAHSELDERALDALKEFPVDGALNVLGQFLESNLEHVSNKSAYLCGVMKTYR